MKLRRELVFEELFLFERLSTTRVFLVVEPFIPEI